MDSSELDVQVPSPSHWYVTDLDISLQFHNHGLVLISALVFSIVILLTLLFFYFIRQYRDHSVGNRNLEVGVAVPTQNNKGLDEDAISSLPTFLHTSLCSGSSGGGGAGVVKQSECSICLALFEENDKVKVIPKCMHVYHLECLDKWLYNHRSCPLCRSTVNFFTAQLPLL